MTHFLNTRVAVARAATLLCGLAFVSACSSSTGSSPVSPSALGSISVSGQTAAKPPALADPGTTAVSFSGFDASTLSVTMNTLTTATVGQPSIDAGKIQLQILVDSLGHPVPCGTAGATYVRFDGTGGGTNPTGGLTAQTFDLDNLAATTGGAVLNVKCGDSICIRAHYVTGGGATKVDTHFSDPTPYHIDCPSCTLSQGFWKTHYPENWPGSVLSGGLTLGSVNYTAAQLESIFNTPVVGNGLVALAHQLIAAKLNIANGAGGGAVASAIASADALIGGLVAPPVGSGYLAPSATSALVQTLDDYNTGCDR